ncbi:MAG: WxcM domain protein [Rickettsiaceae bacterium]|jgi:dTDP-4-dehydrorhamnose 3,5-epimerase-like enzyme|nr:WxcM domain protein [Rickettsiaceae bacterium]
MKIEIIDFEIKGDERGSLIALEGNKNIPFEIKRIYYIFDTKEGVQRGFHAHKKLKQILVCVRGSCKILLDDGKEKSEVILDSPDKGLLIESVIWREMFDFSPDCVLVVLADNYYDEEDYIRDYEEFLELRPYI